MQTGLKHCRVHYFNMYYIIQENLFREFHFKTLIDHLERYNLEYEVIPFKPFTEDLEFKTTRTDIWPFGSTNLARIAKKYNWDPGSMYNENHDFEVYSKYYKQNMLNSDGIICSLEESIPVLESGKVTYTFFARPTKDTKMFSGQLFTVDSWKDWIKDLTDSSVLNSASKESRVLLAPLKQTQQEIRCWIVDKKPVTMSQYKIGNRVVYQNQDNNEEAQIFATKMAKLFSPAEAYVLDICLYNDEYKIVEINTINCSGFYDGDMSKLIQAIENKFSKN